MKIWIKTLNGLIDADGKGPGIYPYLARDLHKIVDSEQQCEEGYRRRKTLEAMVNEQKSLNKKDNMDHVET